jgi:hypothetical protein
MFAKGNLHANGQVLAAYLITGKKGERAELVELRGFAADNIRDAFLDVHIQSEATQAEKPFFHTQVRLPEGEQLTREQWLQVADRIEQQLGFEGQGRAVAFHTYRHSGETHMHIAWSRIDLEQMKAIDPGLYKNQLKELCRDLEHELGLTKVSNERPEDQKTLAPGRNETEQARRAGTDLKAIRESIRECWDRSDNGQSFAAALDEKGFILARGDKRDFVVVDHAGGVHALGKRILGTTPAETRARIADVDKAQLPSVGQAKALQAERAHVAPQLTPAKIVLEAAAGRQRPEPAERGIPTSRPSPENAPASLTTRPIVAPAAGKLDLTASPDKMIGRASGRVLGSVMNGVGRVVEILAGGGKPNPELMTPNQIAAEITENERQAATAAANAPTADEIEQREAAARARQEEERRKQILAALATQQQRGQAGSEHERDDDYGRGREREK